MRDFYRQDAFPLPVTHDINSVKALKEFRDTSFAIDRCYAFQQVHDITLKTVCSNQTLLLIDSDSDILKTMFSLFCIGLLQYDFYESDDAL